MKKIIVIIIVLFFLNCKNISSKNDNNLNILFKEMFENSDSKDFSEKILEINEKIINSDYYDLEIIIQDSLYKSYDYNFIEVSSEEVFPDITSLTICYKSKDSILINNIENKKIDVNYYVKNINANSDEIFVDFSIEASKSGKMNEQEWKNCILYLKKVLNKITDLQNSLDKKVDFRLLFIFKGDCYSNPGPPPPAKDN